MVKNMKNNKGFTLIELIATIGIMILIGLVIVNNMSGILSKEHDEEYNNFKKKLEDSACIYVETKWDSDYRRSCKTSNHCSVSIGQLIEAGYIEDDLKNPNNKELVKDNGEKYKVKVYWTNDNVKTCEMNGE